MWVDILLYNRGPVIQAVQRFEEELTELRRLLASEDAAALRSYLETACGFRQGLDR
jgi:prephenate dehydrogenase